MKSEPAWEERYSLNGDTASDDHRMAVPWQAPDLAEERL